MKNLLFAWLMSLLCLGASAQSINSAKSVVGFSVSNMAFRSVSGTFSDVQGNVQFNPEQVSTSNIQAAIRVASINTGNEKRDEHLRHEDFFDVANHPFANFTSTTVEKYKEGYLATGMLEIRGIKKQVRIPFTVKEAAGETVFAGQLTLDRKAFGVGQKYNRALIGRKVRLEIKCVVEHE